jgi:hypothetical protein
MRKLMLYSLVTAILGITAPCGASDVWEMQYDNTFLTGNMLRHAVPQLQHDLEGAPPNPDQDWMVVRTKLNHSYEARVTGVYWNYDCQDAECPHFDRVDSAGPF